MKASKKDIINFSLVMIIFTIGMVIMLIYKVSTWWVWYVYILVWTAAEWMIAKKMHLKWWHWVLILFGLTCVDLLVIELTS